MKNSPEGKRGPARGGDGSCRRGPRNRSQKKMLDCEWFFWTAGESRNDDGSHKSLGVRCGRHFLSSVSIRSQENLKRAYFCGVGQSTPRSAALLPSARAPLEHLTKLARAGNLAGVRQETRQLGWRTVLARRRTIVAPNPATVLAWREAGERQLHAELLTNREDRVARSEWPPSSKPSYTPTPGTPSTSLRFLRNRASTGDALERTRRPACCPGAGGGRAGRSTFPSSFSGMAGRKTNRGWQHGGRHGPIDRPAERAHRRRMGPDGTM